jgi:hypothetical protein
VDTGCDQETGGVYCAGEEGGEVGERLCHAGDEEGQQGQRHDEAAGEPCEDAQEDVSEEKEEVMPGKKYRSINNPVLYEKLRAKGYSKSQAARISNGLEKKKKKRKKRKNR